MADRGAECAAFPILVDPHADVLFSGSLAHRQRGGGVPDFIDVVELAVRGGPGVREALHDRVVLFEVLHDDGIFRPVVVGADTEHLAPLVGLGCAVAVGGAMERDAAGAFLVRLGDPLDESVIFDTAETLVVDDDIVALRPVRLAVDADFVVATATAFMDDRPRDIRPFADARADDEFLYFVVVAAAASHHESTQRLDLTFGLRSLLFLSSRGDNESEHAKHCHSKNSFDSGSHGQILERNRDLGTKKFLYQPSPFSLSAASNGALNSSASKGKFLAAQPDRDERFCGYFLIL